MFSSTNNKEAEEHNVCVYFCVDLFLLLETGGTGAEGKDER